MAAARAVRLVCRHFSGIKPNVAPAIIPISISYCDRHAFAKALHITVRVIWCPIEIPVGNAVRRRSIVSGDRAAIVRGASMAYLRGIGGGINDLRKIQGHRGAHTDDAALRSVCPRIWADGYSVNDGSRSISGKDCGGIILAASALLRVKVSHRQQNPCQYNLPHCIPGFFHTVVNLRCCL